MNTLDCVKMNCSKWFARVAAMVAIAALFTTGTAQAASYTNIATGNWSADGSWQGGSSGKPSVGGAADAIIVFKPAAADASVNDLAGAFLLNQLWVVTNQTVTLSTNNGSSLSFINAGAMITNAGTSALTLSTPITLGTNLTVGSASGAITINNALSGTGDLTLNANGSGAITYPNNVNITLTGAIINSGTGTNTTQIGAGGGVNIIGSSVSNVVQNSLSSVLLLKSGGTYGALYIKAGTLQLTSDTATGGGTFYLGEPGGASWATLSMLSSASHTWANPIVLGNTSGALLIQVANTSVFSGGVTGTNNLTVKQTAANVLTFSTASLNFVGALTNAGTAGSVTISSVIGPLVTAVVQNSATSPLNLSGINTYTGPTAILAGTLNLTGKLGNGDYPAVIANSGTFVYNSAAAQALGGISGSGLVTISAGMLGSTGTISGPVSVALNAVLAPSLGLGGSNTLTLSSAAANALTLNSGPCLKFALSSTGTNDQINITGGLTLNGANYITLTCPGGGTIPAGTYTLMTYASTNGPGTLALNGSIPNATLNVGDTSVTLTVGVGGTSGTLIGGLTWKGNLSGNWDTSTANWTNGSAAVTYTDGTAVTFDQNASRFSVTGMVAVVSPGSVTFNNTTAYTNRANIGGTGYLSKDGTGTATLTGTNTFTGPIAISAGTLTVGGAGQLGGGNYAGAITHNGALLSFASSAPNTLSGGITATGTVTKSGSGDLTISGTNNFGVLNLSAGLTTVTGTNSAGILNISSGATGLIVNTAMTMSGTVGANGAMIISNATVTASGIISTAGQFMRIDNATLSSMAGNSGIKMNGANYTLSITNGGRLFISHVNGLSIADTATGNNGEVVNIGGLSPSGVPSTYDGNNQGGIAVNGSLGSSSVNTLNVFRGGMITNITYLRIGYTALASNAVMSIRDGGLVEMNTATITVGTGPNNKLINSGGIFQFTTATAPTVTISPNNAFVMTNCTLGYRGVVNVNITNNWGNSGMGTNTVTWQGDNTLRLTSSSATNSLGRPYLFDTNLGSTNFVNLELLGVCAIRGGGVNIGANGTMMLSDAIATISGGVTNFGSIAGSGTITGLVTMASGSSLSPAGYGKLAFSTNMAFAGTGPYTHNWNYNASTCSVVTVGGTLALPATMSLTVTGTGELPANTVFLSWGVGGAPTTTWNVSPAKYVVKATANSFYVTKLSGTLIRLY
ncbi:MAG: autotransporter-associated beta strand repeat-containing protein [bacterium]